MSGIGGLSSLFATGPPPGTVDPFSQGVLSDLTGQSLQAMHNRYAQLGLGVPAQGTGGGSGGPGAQAAASGSSLTYGGPGTAEQMDLGMLPSEVGGIPGMAQATLGQMESNALNQPSGSGGGKGGGIGSMLGPLAGLGGI